MKQIKLGYAHGSVLNIYIVCRLNDLNNSEDSKIRDTVSPNFTTQNCLFGAVKITPDAENESHCKYSGYGICVDAKGKFSFGNRNDARNVMILGVDMTRYCPDYTSLSNEQKYTRDNKFLCSWKNIYTRF